MLALTSFASLRSVSESGQSGELKSGVYSFVHEHAEEKYTFLVLFFGLWLFLEQRTALNVPFSRYNGRKRARREKQHGYGSVSIC